MLQASSTDQELQELIRTAQAGELPVSAIATLARNLAESGEMIPTHKPCTADVASTGGPASLSTILCPLFLNVLGLRVPKLGVPGRPAGGLDVLAQIPGYRTDLSAAEVKTVIDDCGYAHFSAGNRIAPLDGRLFALRQKLNAQNVPSLVIASILSKKIAVGVKTIGLDVRVADHGNFGTDVYSARENAKLFCHVAEILGLDATCILTDASLPYQPYIGRGEALLALLHFFSGSACPWLQRHADQCSWIASATVGLPPSLQSGEELYKAFASNVNAQGGSIEGFSDIAHQVETQHKYSVVATNSGFPVFNLQRLRQIIVGNQREAKRNGEYPDPLGAILLIQDSQLISQGDPVMTVRSENMSDDLMDELSSCVVVSELPPPSLGEMVSG